MDSGMIWSTCEGGGRMEERGGRREEEGERREGGGRRRGRWEERGGRGRWEERGGRGRWEERGGRWVHAWVVKGSRGVCGEKEGNVQSLLSVSMVTNNSSMHIPFPTFLSPSHTLSSFLPQSFPQFFPPSLPPSLSFPPSSSSHLSDIVDKFSGEVSGDAGEVRTLHLGYPLTRNGKG